MRLNKRKGSSILFAKKIIGAQDNKNKNKNRIIDNR